jgi:hypothetical protein
MRTITRRTPFSSTVQVPGARAAIERIAPSIFGAPVLQNLSDFPTGPLLGIILGSEDPRIPEIMDAITGFEDVTEVPPAAAPVFPSNDYEAPHVARGSATVTQETSIAPGAVELVFAGPSHGNPFLDVELSADFHHDDETVTVGGFYDGGGSYRVRFLPNTAGQWSYTTRSNARSLDGITGSVTAEADGSHGPVHAVGQRFEYADGTAFTPLGTTAYVWTLQEEHLQEQTLTSFASAPFNKVRMGLFPKDFMHNSNEPERYPFERTETGWDPERFDAAYFAKLEKRIAQLAGLGIEADVILFHPYDRWGFSKMGETVDHRYARYVVRRLAAFHNIWWSLANEYDLLTTKSDDDWNRIGELVQAEDHVGHLLSIHNWVDIFDYSADWATHTSIQGGGFRMGELTARWRGTWGKPVVVDEFGYEGDLDQGWGNLTAEEVVRRFWDGTIAGGYLTHGETFYSEDDVIFWSKGGELRGESLPRLRFLRDLVAASPTGYIEPLTGDWDAPWAGIAGEYILISFGGSRPLFRHVPIPDGMTAKIEVIDAWNMTIDEIPGEHTGLVRVPLPARPHTLYRLTGV